MPISQDRVIALISEGEAIVRSLESLREECISLIDRQAAGALSPEEALDLLHSYIQTSPIPAPLNLRLEAAHFKRNARRNERRKERNRTARGGLHHPEVSPTTLQTELTRPSQQLDDLEQFNNWNQGVYLDDLIPQSK